MDKRRSVCGRVGSAYTRWPSTVIRASHRPLPVMMAVLPPETGPWSGWWQLDGSRAVHAARDQSTGFPSRLRGSVGGGPAACIDVLRRNALEEHAVPAELIADQGQAIDLPGGGRYLVHRHQGGKAEQVESQEA